MFYVYLLQSTKDGTYYIGQTDYVEERVSQHNAGAVQSTKARRPWQLLGYETYPTRSAARYCEIMLKKHSDRKRQFIKNLLHKHKK